MTFALLNVKPNPNPYPYTSTNQMWQRWTVSNILGLQYKAIEGEEQIEEKKSASRMEWVERSVWSDL